MKHQNQEKRFRGINMILLTLLCLMASVSIQAQKVVWTAGFPKTNPTPIITLEQGYIQVQFTPTGANLISPRVEITLPTSVTYDGATATIAGHDNAALGAVTSAAGKVTVNFAANLTKDKVVAFQVRIKTTCEFAGAAAAVQVIANGQPVPDELTNATSKAVTINAQQPNFVVVPPTGTATQTVANLGQDGAFTLNIRVANGTANGLKLTFTTDQYLTLSAFSMTGVTITQPTAPTAAPYKWEITLPTSFNATNKVLSFKARTSRSGARAIKVEYAYSTTTPACVTASSSDLVLNRPAANVGTPKVDGTSARYVQNDLSTPLNIYDAPMDGVTPTILEVVYTAANTADAYDLGFYVEEVSDGFGHTYIQQENIRYKVGDGGTVKPLPVENIIVRSRIKNDNLNNNVLKTSIDAANPPKGVNLYPTDVLPAGQKIYFYIPLVQGLVYDNTGNTKDVLFGLDNWTATFCYRAYVSRVLTEDGLNGTVGNYVGGPSQSHPKIPTKSAPVGIHTSGTGKTTVQMQMGTVVDNTYTNATYTNTVVTGAQTTEIFVKLPEWMQLRNNNPATAIEITNANNNVVPTTVITQGSNTYSVVMNLADAIINFTVNFEVAPAFQAATTDRTDNIEYWLNYNLAQTNLRPTRVVLERFGQMFQQATLFAEINGIRITDFGVKRTSIGLKDNDDNEIPDDGTPANPNDPTFRHDLFYLNDNGKVQIKGTIAGTPANTYQNMYILMSSHNMNFDTQINWSAGTIKVNGTLDNSVSLELQKVSTTQYYVLYKKPLKGGDIVEIELPFVAKGTFTSYRTIKAEVYMTAADNNYTGSQAFNNTTTATTRLGKEFGSSEIKVGGSNLYYNGDNYPKNSWANNTVQTKLVNKFANDRGTYYSFVTPYETRQLYQFKRFELDVPDGYVVTDAAVLSITDVHNGNRVLTAPLLEKYPYSNANSSGTTYVYDLTAVHDPNCTDAVPCTPLWAPVDEFYYFDYRLPIQATKAVTLGDTRTQQRTILDDRMINDANRTLSSNLIWTYTGDATRITAGLDTVSAYGKAMTVPAVRIENPNNKEIKTYLYIDGNVTNVKFKQGATTLNGGGYQGRWITLNNFAAKTYQNGELLFDYLGSEDCNDVVTVYTVSNFSTTVLTPTTLAAALDKTNVNINGAKKVINIKAAPASISGAISMGSGILVYNQAYPLTATVDATASPACSKMRK